MRIAACRFICSSKFKTVLSPYAVRPAVLLATNCVTWGSERWMQCVSRISNSIDHLDKYIEETSQSVQRGTVFLLASSSCWPVYWKHVKGVAGVQAYMLYSRGYNTMKRGWWWGWRLTTMAFTLYCQSESTKAFLVQLSQITVWDTDCACGAGSLIFSPPSLAPLVLRSSIVSHPLQCCFTVGRASAIYCLILCFLRGFVSAASRKREHRHVTNTHRRYLSWSVLLWLK